MTDALTDAVKRLKQLQADVERLKAGQDEEGEPRLFITTQDLAEAIDALDLKANDISAADLVEAADEQTDLRLQRTMETGFYNRAGYQTAGFNDIDIIRFNSAETAAGVDTLALKTEDILSDDIAAGVDTLALKTEDILSDDIAAGVDTLALQATSVKRGTYNEATYLTNAYDGN